MKTLSAAETRDNLENVVVEVMHGETFVVTDDKTGEPIAKIIPVPGVVGEPNEVNDIGATENTDA